MDTKVIAVVGCGRISQTHLPIMDRLDNVRVKYACDLIEEKAQKAKDEHPKIENVITDYKIALNDPEVDDFITGFVRTSGASISFNGAWAQNIDKSDFFIDFMGDKAGARLTYRSKFELYDGETLETIEPDYDMNDMFFDEDKAFVEAISTGEKTRSHISNVLRTMKMLDTLYKSADAQKEIEIDY